MTSRINEIIYKRNRKYHTGVISDLVIGTLDFGFEDFSEPICVENCIIDTLILHNARFKNGFTLKNCIIRNKVQYEMGGHNEKPIAFVNNIFHSVFVFLDCIFEDEIIVKGNVFLDGCTLCNGWNTFEKVTIENNIGKMDDDRWD